MKDTWISNEHIIMIITSVIVGTLARVFTIKEDYHQYPSYPNGYLNHLISGFISAAVGAVAIPAIMTKNFIAVTFLTAAAQQFRDVRRLERESLKDLEKTEYAFRGNAYIDGIAKTFESRNYFSLVVALMTSITMQTINAKSQWINVIAGAVVGFVIFYLLKRFSKGKTIGDIAEVTQGKIEIKENELYVDGLFISNLLGTDHAATLFSNEGLAVIIKPHKNHLRLTLEHFGQRQAALYEATRALGLKRYHFTRRDFDNGRIVITLVPIINDIDRLIEAVKKTPLLESVKKSKAVMKTNLAGKK